MMRYTRWIVLGIGGLVATATGVGALTGTSPTRTIVNLVAVVDELGNVLFGSKPGKVEVTNFPSQPGAGKIFDAEPVTNGRKSPRSTRQSDASALGSKDSSVRTPPPRRSPRRLRCIRRQSQASPYRRPPPLRTGRCES